MKLLLAHGLHLLDLAVEVAEDLVEALLFLVPLDDQGLEVGEGVVFAVEPIAGRLLGELGAERMLVLQDMVDDFDVFRPERGQEQDMALAFAQDHGHGRAVCAFGQEFELAVRGRLFLPDALGEGLGEQAVSLGDERPEPFEGDME